MLNNARFVIIGGGGFGLAAAQALVNAGGIEGSDILIIGQEKTLRACGEASGLGSGLIGQVRHSAASMRLLKEAAEGLAALHGRTAPIHHNHRHKDHQPGQHHQEESDYHGLEWHQTGSLRLGDSAQETETLVRHAKEAGVEVQVLHKPEVQKKFPQLVLKGNHQSALWCPTDGYFTPAALTKAYERLLHGAGVRFSLETTVQALEMHHHSHRMAAVLTNKGTIQCEYVINAAELQTYRMAQLAHLEIPVFPVRHNYVVTEKIEGLELQHQLPCFRFPHLGAYGRASNGSLLLGGFSSDPSVMDPRSLIHSDKPRPATGPVSAGNDLPELRKSLSPHFSFARPLDQYKVERAGTTWHTFVPDGKPIVGESSKVPGLVIMAGCNGHGVSCAPGLADALVQALFDKNPSDHIRQLSPNRFLDNAASISSRHWPQLLARTREISSSYYQSEH